MSFHSVIKPPDTSSAILDTRNIRRLQKADANLAKRRGKLGKLKDCDTIEA